MSSLHPKQVLIYKDANIKQKESLKNHQKPLRILKDKVGNKENPCGSLKHIVNVNSTKAAKQIHKDTQSTKDHETQTSRKSVRAGENDKEKKITEEDITGDSPSEYYWERLARRIQKATEETLKENRHLTERIEGLKKELQLSKQQLEEAKHLVAVLTEMLNETETEKAADQEETKDDPEANKIYSS